MREERNFWLRVRGVEDEAAARKMPPQPDNLKRAHALLARRTTSRERKCWPQPTYSDAPALLLDVRLDLGFSPVNVHQLAPELQRLPVQLLQRALRRVQHGSLVLLLQDCRFARMGMRVCECAREFREAPV